MLSNKLSRRLFCLSTIGTASLGQERREELLYNGIVLPAEWPPLERPTQELRNPQYLAAPPAFIPVDIGRQLFVDDFLIERTTLSRVYHRPRFHEGNPVLTSGKWPDTKQWAMPFSDGVWFDPEDEMFKMWYFGGLGNGVSLAYSRDGLSWTRPTLPSNAATNGNMVLVLGGGRDSATVWMDLEGPIPERRFKAFTYAGRRRMRVFYSRDGIHWVEDKENVISAPSDRTTVFWNPFRKVWVNSARFMASLPASGNKPERTSRARYYSESRDLRRWNPQKALDTFWVGPDVNDPPYRGITDHQPELYNLDAVAYESLLIGLFSWFYPPPGPDLVELGVGFSRDGFGWYRPVRGSNENAFIPATNKDGDWNGFNTQSAGGGFLVVGDELWFYFSGRDSRHSFPSESTSAGLASLRRDGFASMDAGPAGGTLTTRPVWFPGRYMFVNVDAPDGDLRVEVLDERGRPIPAYSAQNSVSIRTAATRAPVKWRQRDDLSELSRQPVRFRFHLNRGRLYSFWVTTAASGASHGYVAAGGPGFASPLDTEALFVPKPGPVVPSRSRTSAVIKRRGK